MSNHTHGDEAYFHHVILQKLEHLERLIQESGHEKIADAVDDVAESLCKLVESNHGIAVQLKRIADQGELGKELATKAKAIQGKLSGLVEETKT